ncbi:MAG: M35 family metallo-endopeptidase, partial [Pseudomonadota bacterium]
QPYIKFLQGTHVTINLAQHFFDLNKTAAHSSEIVDDKTIVDETLQRHMKLARDRETAKMTFFQDIQAPGANIEARAQSYDLELAAIQKQIGINAARLSSSQADKISVAGVIVHETSHNVVNTKDIKKDSVTMYGPSFCAWLALHHPEDATNNADSYRLYCEEFM